jgi:hypothetical protein
MQTNFEDLITLAKDREHMLGVLQEVVPPLAGIPVRVTECRVKTKKAKKRVDADAPVEIMYHVTVEAESGEKWKHTVLATLPVGEDCLRGELADRCRDASESTLAVPFERLATYVPELRMEAHLLPVDLALPALLEFTGRRRCEILGAFLPECRSGTKVDEVETEVKQYKRGTRVVLRSRVHLTGGGERVVFLKVFADDRGEANDRCMRSLWDATRGARHLRIPEPLGYDQDLRTVVTEEIPGSRDFVDWIQAIEDGKPLPADVDGDRLHGCVTLAARAIAELHACGLEVPDRCTFRDEIVDRLADFEALRKLEPRVAEAAESLMSRLRSDGPQRDDLVCSHGGYRHKQMLGNEKGLAIVDWDGICMAHPAQDASTFLSHLRQVPVCSPGEASILEELAVAFRREVLAADSAVTPHDLALFEAMAFAQKICRAYRRGAKDEDRFDEVTRLIKAAEQLLDDADEAGSLSRAG